MSLNHIISSLCIYVSVTAVLPAPTLAEAPLDSVKFPASIAHKDVDDVAFREYPSFRQKRRGWQHDNLQLLHSNIDRDPIDIHNEYNEELQSSLLDYERRDLSWKSPLEQVYPLQPKQHNDQVSFTPESLPVIIQDGPYHSHQITQHHNLHSQTNLQLKTRKTGTTITALLACNSTVLILAADTRATDGTTVADSRCEKLHQIARNIWCAGAGTSGDVEAIVRSVKFMFWKRGMLNEVGNPERKKLPCALSENEEDAPVASLPAILHCLRTQLQKTRGQLGVNLLVGGYDAPSHRATLAAIHPHGSMDVVTYGALGSGGLAATGVLESMYPKIGSGECTLEEGIRLAVDAVRAGVDNDLGSGSQVDVCIIAKEGVLYRRAVVKEEALEWVDESEKVKVPSRKDIASDGGGVNGFGNVPFAIHSERVVVSGEKSAHSARRRWLNDVLGTNEQ